MKVLLWSILRYLFFKSYGFYEELYYQVRGVLLEVIILSVLAIGTYTYYSPDQYDIIKNLNFISIWFPYAFSASSIIMSIIYVFESDAQINKHKDNKYLYLLYLTIVISQLASVTALFIQLYYYVLPFLQNPSFQNLKYFMNYAGDLIFFSGIAISIFIFCNNLFPAIREYRINNLV